jgi:hypothetical protein
MNTTIDNNTYNDDSELCDRKLYLSIIMSLMYLARFTRADILFAVTYLATKCETPTNSDMKTACNILEYLDTVPDYQLVFTGDDIYVKVFVDASYGLHTDGKGHLGIFVVFNSAPIIQKSLKQKTVALSSTEAEIIAVVESITYLIWVTIFLQELGFIIMSPIPIYQDNLSAISLYTNGGIFKRSKHMLIKTSYIRDILSNNIAIFKYLESTEHPSDMLTKPLSRSNITKLLNKLSIFPTSSQVQEGMLKK